MLQRTPGVDYVSADLRPGVAMHSWDITAVPAPDAAFDAVICSHVLEHVEDDRAALTETLRVLRPGGWAIVLVPIDLDRAMTLEDPEIVDPAERERVYWQADHVRLYGADLPERLRAAGFDVTVDGWARGSTRPRPSASASGAATTSYVLHAASVTDVRALLALGEAPVAADVAVLATHDHVQGVLVAHVADCARWRRPRARARPGPARGVEPSPNSISMCPRWTK